MLIQTIRNRNLAVPFFLLAAAVQGLGENTEIYLYEPVVLSIPYQTAHLESTYVTNMVITCPCAVQVTNQISSDDLFGVTNGMTMFFLSSLKTNMFTTSGLYSVVLGDVTNTVSVLAPTGADRNVVPFLDSATLLRIALNRGRCDLDAGLKTACERIMSLSPNGVFAPYAKTYLAIDAFYSSLVAQSERGTALNFSAIGVDLVSMAVPQDITKWALFYNRGCVYKMRKDKQNTLNTFVTLTNSIQYSAWTRNATMFLDAIP